MKALAFFIIFLATISFCIPAGMNACTIVYYKDPHSGNVFAANNEDFWYNVKPYIQIVPPSETEYARLWYGWKRFAQGGVNEAGLFFDAATTPGQPLPAGYIQPKGNLGDEILAYCATVQDAIGYLEKKNVILSDAHFLFGDKTGNAVVVEWIDGKQAIIRMGGNYLAITNYLLSNPAKANYPCPRYESVIRNMEQLEAREDTVTLQLFGNVLRDAVQLPRKNTDGKTGGTLYSSFIDITHMQFTLVYKLDNSKITRLDLVKEFGAKKSRKIRLK